MNLTTHHCSHLIYSIWGGGVFFVCLCFKRLVDIRGTQAMWCYLETSCLRKVKKISHKVSTASLPTRTKRFCAPHISGFSASHVCEIPQTKTLLRLCRQKEKRVNIMQSAFVYASRLVAVHSLSSSWNPNTQGAWLTSPLRCNLCVIRQIHKASARPGASAS